MRFRDFQKGWDKDIANTTLPVCTNHDQKLLNGAQKRYCKVLVCIISDRHDQFMLVNNKIQTTSVTVVWFKENH